MPAHPMPSAISENPGPEVEVEALTPVRAPPTAMVIAAISSSVCTTATEASIDFASLASGPSMRMFSWASRYSLSSLAGVIG